jgi:DNA-binding MarR family transcriptional regulator
MSDPVSQLIASGKKLAARRKSWQDSGYRCDPCDPLLPITQPTTFYGEENIGYRKLIAEYINFVHDSERDLVILKGPRGTGKSVLAQILVEYNPQIGISASYQNAASVFLGKTTIGLGDVILLDNAMHFQMFSSLKSFATSHSPKIIALMDSTEFEVYRRQCILKGDLSYQHYLSMPQLKSSEIEELLRRRLHVCLNDEAFRPAFIDKLSDIANLAYGNPGLAIRILEETLKFSRDLDDINLTFAVNIGDLDDFPKSKLSILQEILIREIEQEFTLSSEGFLRHKDIADKIKKTKSTISHHLGDLLNRNLIFEESAGSDKREKAYRPNKTIFGVLEYLAFERSSVVDTLITSEGIYREK